MRPWLPETIEDLEPGVNPYELYRERVQGVLYLKPTAGFKTRLIVLLVLLSWMLVASLGNLALLSLKAKRTGDKLWLFRLVRREEGTYIVGNHLLLSYIAPIVYFVSLMGSTIASYLIYAQGAPEIVKAPLRLLMWPSFFLMGWLITSAGVQAFALTAGGDRRFRLSPRFLNAIFIGVLAMGIIVLFILYGIGMQASVDKAIHYQHLVDVLRVRVPAWNGTTDPLEFAQVRTETREFFDAVHEFDTTSVVILSIYSAIPLFLAILNLSVFALVRIIRRQIQESNEHLRSKQLFEEAVGTVFVLDRTTTAAEDERPVEPSATDASDETQVDEVSDKDTSAPGAPSRQAQVAIDLGGGAVTTVGSQGETSKRIHRLMVAERELFLSCCTVSIFMLCISVTALWCAINFRRHTSDPNWNIQEAILFLPNWLCGVIFSVAHTFSFFRNLKHLPPSCDHNATAFDRHTVSRSPRLMQDVRRRQDRRGSGRVSISQAVEIEIDDDRMRTPLEMMREK